MKSLFASLVLLCLAFAPASAWMHGSGPITVRIAATATDVAYVITPSPWGTALAYKFQRNVGGSDVTDCGTPWQPWRRTGTFELLTVNSDPTVPLYTFGSDIGAFDYNIQRGTILINGLSYHGCEVVNTQSILLDGAAIDFSANLTGSSFQLSHTSTGTWSDASTATTSYSLAVAGVGVLAESTTLTSAFATAAVTNIQMDIGANDFTQVIIGGVTTDVTATAVYSFAKAPVVTMRSPSTGYTILNSSNAPSNIAVYSSTLLDRQNGTRSKLYFRPGSTSGSPLGTISASRTITYGKGTPG